MSVQCHYGYGIRELRKVYRKVYRRDHYNFPVSSECLTSHYDTFGVCIYTPSVLSERSCVGYPPAGIFKKINNFRGNTVLFYKKDRNM